MKSLSNPNDKAELLRRLRSIRPDSKRRWGKMNPHQMICHLSDAYMVYTGERKVAFPPIYLPRTLMRWFAVWVPLPWPRGFPTAPELDQQAGGGTPPVEFERDARELEQIIERYAQLPAGHSWPAHPAFGRMSPKEWMRLGFLHADHHFRQFSA
jgi:hypothetical protein